MNGANRNTPAESQSTVLDRPGKENLGDLRNSGALDGESHLQPLRRGSFG
jgi:hypothetical protein